MKYTIFSLCIGLGLVGCLDTVTDPRPGPITETDAELFDARPPSVSTNTGSGYGNSGAYNSGTYGENSIEEVADMAVADNEFDGGLAEDGTVDEESE